MMNRLERRTWLLRGKREGAYDIDQRWHEGALRSRVARRLRVLLRRNDPVVLLTPRWSQPARFLDDLALDLQIGSPRVRARVLSLQPLQARSVVETWQWLVRAIAEFAPSAALTVKGSVDVGAATLGVHNPDVASGGITVRAGGNLIGSALRLTTAPGGAAGASVSTQDAALSSIDSDRLFTTHFGVDKANWSTHAAVLAIDCRSECAARVASAIDGVAANRMVSITGDARLSGPVTLGSAARPVLLVVDGTLTLSGDVTLYGLVYASKIHWDDSSSPQAQARGALISASTYSGNGASDLHYDAEMLRALQLHTGSFARVPGSWRDF